MKLIGLTGGIGMGKSTAGELLRQRGVPVVDTDALAREVVEPGQPALGEIQRAFGGDIVGSDGRLRREELARRVFADAASRAQLETIVHPRIRERWLAQVAAWRAAGKRQGVVIIPLLFETNAAAHFDFIVCVACSAATQRERLRARGWSAEQSEQRINAQWPMEKKIAAAHAVIWTEAGLEVQDGRTCRLVRRDRTRAGLFRVRGRARLLRGTQRGEEDLDVQDEAAVLGDGRRDVARAHVAALGTNEDQGGQARQHAGEPSANSRRDHAC